MEALPHISEVAPAGPDDQAIFDDIIGVLKKHNALRRFGVTLLHQHFDIGDDEILVEDTDPDTRLQTIQPRKKAEIADLPAIITSWRLDSGRPMMGCLCIKLRDHTHLPRPSDLALKQDVRPLSGAADMLSGLRPSRYRYQQGALSDPLPSGEQLGLIAQDLEAILPELVSYRVDEATGVRYKVVDYVGLIPVLVAALQETRAEVAAMKSDRHRAAAI